VILGSAGGGHLLKCRGFTEISAGITVLAPYTVADPYGRSTLTISASAPYCTAAGVPHLCAQVRKSAVSSALGQFHCEIGGPIEGAIWIRFAGIDPAKTVSARTAQHINRDRSRLACGCQIEIQLLLS